MDSSLLGHNNAHLRKNIIMLMETLGICVVFSMAIFWSYKQQYTSLLWVVIVAQGIWFQRIYCVGHEASHQKLFPKRTKLNDIVGQLFLWIILVPLPIFRKIHRFHHGSNRKNEHTSALDVYIIPKDASRMRRLVPYLLWYAGIALGGWFLHSLISILLFLFLPLQTAQKISPAFRGWKRKDQQLSIACFVFPICIHVIVAHVVGLSIWLHLYLWPLLVFSLVYSLQLYVYHYDTSIGPKTLFHARRLARPKFIGWWLLNLNEHDTHHQRPKIVWYKLPTATKPLPTEFVENQNTSSFLKGILYQFKGPTIVEK